jgi:hypothetical protein
VDTEAGAVPGVARGHAPDAVLPAAATGELASSPALPGTPRRSRWTVIRATPSQAVSTRSNPPGGADLAAPGRPPGTPGLLTDRILVQTSAGAQLSAVLAYVDQAHGGLVLSQGRMTNRANFRKYISDLRDQGFLAPTVFDPEAYRKHVASTDSPFLLENSGLFSETLEENIVSQCALGVDVAQTPTGYIRRDSVDALEAAVGQVAQIHRQDFMFTVPLEVTVLDDPALAARVWRLLNQVGVPISLILGGQFDPLGSNVKSAEARIRILREFAAGPVDVAAMRTDFNAFDLLCHGGFTGAIGSGGSMRHAPDPEERSLVIDRTDESPSVLYERLASWKRGSTIAREHGRMPAPNCMCVRCDGRRISRFLSREDSDDARAHGVLIWQEWTRAIVGQSTVANRASYWRNFCRAKIDEHALLSAQLRRAKQLVPHPALKAWAKLSS